MSLQTRTRLFAAFGVTFCVLLLLAFLHAQQLMTGAVGDLARLSTFKNTFSEFRTVTLDYFTDGGQRPLTQMKSKLGQLQSLVSALPPAAGLPRGGAADIDWSEVREQLSACAALLAQLPPPASQADSEWDRRTMRLFLLRSQSVVTALDKLQGPLAQRLELGGGIAEASVAALAGSLLVLLILAVLLLERAILRPLAQFGKGFDQVIAGNFAIRLRSERRDEIGLLACAFDATLERLQQVTVSRDRLQREIDERERAEQALALSDARFQRLINANMIGIVIANATGDILEANDYYLELLGRTRAELADGKVRWIEMTPPEWLAADQQAIAELGAGGTCAPYEKEYVRRDGSRKAVFIAKAMLPGPQEQILAVVLDITGRKQAETAIRDLNTELDERVRQRTTELQAANKELEAFAYSVSHDLRAPLRAVDGFARKVEAGFAGALGDEGRRQLRVIRDNAQRMGQLIDDLLVFSRMGRREMTLTPVDMRDLAQAVGAEACAAEQGRVIELSIADLPAAEGDPAMLRQVWFNLLSNAVKFTRPRPVARIDVSGRRDGAEQVYAIRDNGVGFDMQYADKLFGVFQRLHGMDEFEGTGVGLALSQRIIHRHGGRIWAEARLDAGATFYFTLPLERPTGPEKLATSIGPDTAPHSITQ